MKKGSKGGANRQTLANHNRQGSFRFGSKPSPMKKRAKSAEKLMLDKL